MGIFWGFALIWVGLSYLGASIGWWDYGSASEIWLYWPLILIFGGFSAILRDKKFSGLILTFLLLATSFLIYDFTFSGQSILFSDAQRGYFHDAVESVEDKIEIEKATEIDTLRYKMNVGAIKLNISGATEKAISGYFASNMMKMTERSEVSGRTQTVELTNDNFGDQKIWLARRLENKLQLALSKDLPIEVEVNSGASAMDLNLSEYQLRALKISSGASDLRLRLGQGMVNDANVSINTGAASVKIDLPENLGVRVETEDGLTAKNFRGFTQKDGAYYNEAYENATVRIRIVLKTGASSIEINEY